MTTAIEPVKSKAGLVEDLFELEAQKKELAEKKKEVQEKIDWVTNELLERMSAEGIKQIKDDYGRIVFISDPKLHARINKADEQAAHELLREWGEGEHIKETITPATVSRIVKERLKAGLHVDGEVFKYHLEPNLGKRSK